MDWRHYRGWDTENPKSGAETMLSCVVHLFPNISAAMRHSNVHLSLLSAMYPERVGARNALSDVVHKTSKD